MSSTAESPRRLASRLNRALHPLPAEEERRKGKMKKFDLIGSAFWLIIGFLICEEAWRINLGEFRNPGPGFLPFGTGLIRMTRPRRPSARRRPICRRSGCGPNDTRNCWSTKRSAGRTTTTRRPPWNRPGPRLSIGRRRLKGPGSIWATPGSPRPYPGASASPASRTGRW